MRSADNIKKLIKNTKIKTNPEVNKVVLDDLENRMDNAQGVNMNATRQNMWRIIMESKITRTAVAVFIFAGLVSLLFMDNTVAPAYAIEQTLEAMQKLRTVHMHCRDWNNSEYEMWIQLDPKSGEPEYCRAYWPKQKVLNISTPKTSYQYNERANQVQINSGKLYSIGIAPARIFEQLLQASKMDDPNIKVQISHGYNSEFDKELIVAISETPYENWKIFVDPETKLPVRMHCLKMANKLGAIFKDVDQIEFNIDLPEDIFEFEIPKGARILDHDQNNKLINDPQNGMSSKGLSEQQAAEKLVAEYWNALIANDKNTAKKLSPVSPEIVDGSLIAELAKVGKLYIQPGCGIGKLMPCTLKYKDGSFKRWNLIIDSRKIDGNESIVINSHYGGPMSTVVFPKAYDDTDYGLSTEGLSDDQASKKTVEAYWRAIIDADWDNLALLMPFFNAEQWESNLKNKESQPIEILEIGQPLRKKDCTIGPVVPCRIKYSDGQVKNPYMAVKIRNLNGKKSCLIAGTYRGKKDSAK